MLAGVQRPRYQTMALQPTAPRLGSVASSVPCQERPVHLCGSFPGGNAALNPVLETVETLDAQDRLEAKKGLSFRQRYLCEHCCDKASHAAPIGCTGDIFPGCLRWKCGKDGGRRHPKLECTSEKSAYTK